MTNKKVSQEERDAIVAAYLDGATLAEAAKPFGYSLQVTLNSLKKVGIKPRNNFASLEKIDEICKMYASGKSCSEVGRIFGCSGNSVSNYLKKSGLLARSISDAKRIYYLDETFFENIDTEEKAYWLGFITADAGICNNCIHISLKIDDKNHLQKFLDIIKSNYPIHTTTKNIIGKTYYGCRIIVTSKKMVSDLLQHGVGECKSFTVKPCKNIPENLMRHYFRGLVEGDGWLSINKKYFRVGLCGNYDIVSGFHNFVKQFVDTKVSIRQDDNIYGVDYSGKDSPKQVISLLYKDATIYLDRKKAKADEILGM